MRHALGPGSEVGGYRIGELLGEGATGAVYRAGDAEGRTVALKVLDRELATDARFRERFLRESGVAAILQHPSIVPVLAAGEDDGVLFLAMEWVDGSDLRDLLRRDGPFEPERAVALIEDVAAGPRRGACRRADPPRRQAGEHPRGRRPGAAVRLRARQAHRARREPDR